MLARGRRRRLGLIVVGGHLSVGRDAFELGVGGGRGGMGGPAAPWSSVTVRAVAAVIANMSLRCNTAHVSEMPRRHHVSMNQR
jgi:hypothetical protein